LSKSLTGKGVSLAFFLVFICLLSLPSLSAFSQDFPVIRRLDPSDTMFRQFISDVEGNRRRVSGAQTRSAEEIAQYLTIYQYTPRQEDDIFFLSARLNIPYSALTSINRLNSPSALESGKTLLLPSCPGIFIPVILQTDLEKITGAARQNRQGSVELKIRTPEKQETFLFFPGADFTPTERAFFLNSGFRFPLRQYRVTSSYGIREDPFSGRISMHQGIDLAEPEGTEVFAAADGVVTATGFDPVYGNYIIISHSNNWKSLYGHLLTVETLLRTDVKSGNLIGRVGSTGQSTGPHLHFELRQDGRAFDPAGRLRP
jgi:murein DD-endopeptidase MepM/ murein hydrolase activator NlpD